MRVNRTWKVSAACVVFVAASMAAQAAEPPWSFIEGGYLNNDPDISELDAGDNWFAGGSFGGKWFHVFAEYLSGDFADGIDQTNWKVGAGWHGLLGEPADLVAEVAYLQNDDPFDSSGWGGTVGIRWRIIKLFEVAAFANYVDLGDSDGDFGDLDGDTTGELQALVYVWRLGIGAKWEGGGDLADQYAAFIRFNFGKK